MANEIVKFEFDHTPIAGAWRPSGDGTPSGIPVEFDDTASDLEIVVDNLGAIGPNNTVVTGDYTTGFVIEFVGIWANSNPYPLAVYDSTLVYAGSVTFDTTQEGATGVNAIQTIVIDATDGTFTINVSGFGVSGSIAWNTSAGDLQTALNAVHASMETSVSGSAGSFTIEFVGPSAETPIVQMEMSTNGLTKPVTPSFSTIQEGSAATVTLSATPTTIAENLGASEVTATLDTTHSADVIVDLAFTGTATLDTDYSATSTSILISTGQLTGAVTVTSINDASTESNETIIIDIDAINLESPTNGRSEAYVVENGTQQVTLTITDDDGSSAGNLPAIQTYYQKLRAS